ncbi:hypothetical protein P7C71_g449, partial [Lecanoromycetidae sp. Uapishka_2]
MLYVISRQRVYLAHYWEGMVFTTALNPNADADFQTQVIGFLNNGYTANGIQQDSLAQHAADFPAAGTFAVILSPDTSLDASNPAGVFVYPAKVQQMAATVAQILNMPAPVQVNQGAQFPIGQVSTQTYVRINRNAPGATNTLENTATGHMIFDFDPQGILGRTRNAAAQAAYRTIWQNGIILADQWNAASTGTAPAAAAATS